MFSEKEKGLSNKEVKLRLEQYGLNVLPEKPPPSYLYLVIQQLKSPLVYVLIFAALITLVIGHYSDTVIISIAILINTILGFIQESKASNALYALKRYVTSKAIVIREGKRISIETSKVVPGDVVVLSQGMNVPADGKITFANRLYVEEAILTGESMPVSKVKGDMVFMGTTVSSGQAIVKVEKTGVRTKIGAIAGEIQEIEEDTPFQRQLKRFSKQLIVIIVSLTVLVFFIGVWNRFSAKEIFLTSVALAVSSIPEGLLVSLTVVLAIGMQRILKHYGLVRKLSAAETLGGVTVICVDKTGTLTSGKMKVVDCLGDKEEIAKQVILANDLDDPIVIAAFEWGRSVIYDDIVVKHPRFDSIPFSPKERFFASLHRWTDKNNIVFVNGSPELLLEWSVLTDRKRKEVLSEIENLAKHGKRIVGFARKEISLSKTSLQVDDIRHNLTWVGLLAFSDPVRSGVKDALNRAIVAGIRVVVITGDHPHTSKYVLEELGISVGDQEVITGDELNSLSDKQLAERVRSVKLFARTTPDQKLRIVEVMKKSGEIVAMMGDGVNDAPALHKADIGIVVGEATDVARESADLVLLDSNFSTIVKAIEEGRAMFENIRKIILYLLSDSFAEIIVVVGGVLLGLPLPITAAQILWINLISDGLPNLSLTIDPPRADLMKEKPRSPNEQLVNRWMIILIGVVSFFAGLVALSCFIVVYKMTGNLTTARSVTFLTLGLNSLAYVFSVRGLMLPFWKYNIFENKWLLAAVAAGFGLQILPFVLLPLRQFFKLSSLGIEYWFFAASLSIIIFFLIELFKIVYRLRMVKKWVRAT